MSDNKETLCAELAKRQDVNLEEVLEVGRMANGQLVWLEMGNHRAGWTHIVLKLNHFERRGISPEELPIFLITALTQGYQIRLQGTRPVYELLWNGEWHYVAITVGNNGFIVGANPAPRKHIPTKTNA